ncbi:MAG: energy transducer TonB [Planctomycetota bacterium]
MDAGPRANGGNRDPDYPRSLLRRRRPPSGTVDLRFTIDERGAVTDLELVSDGGTPAFGEAALERVRGWRFTPARKDGRAVAVRVRKTFRFAVSER